MIDKLNLMSNSKSFYSIFALCFLSFGMSAQTFLSGDSANDAIFDQHVLVKTDFISEMVSAGFDNAEDYVAEVTDAQQDFLLINSLNEFIVQDTDTPVQVSEALKDLVIAKSQDFIPISSNDYDNSILGSQEIENLYNSLLAIVSE